MRRAVPLVLLSAVVVMTTEAAASFTCIERPPTIQPQGGPVGPNPTLYLAGLDASMRFEVMSADGPIDYELIKHGATDMPALLEIRVRKDHGRIEVRVPQLPPVWFDLDQPPLRPPQDSPSVVDFVRHDGRVVCPRKEGVVWRVFAPSAIAFRLTWRDGTTSLAPGPSVDTAHIHLGTFSCEASALPDGKRDSDLIAISALYADGSDRRVSMEIPSNPPSELPAARRTRDRVSATGPLVNGSLKTS